MYGASRDFNSLTCHSPIHLPKSLAGHDQSRTCQQHWSQMSRWSCSGVVPPTLTFLSIQRHSQSSRCAPVEVSSVLDVERTQPIAVWLIFNPQFAQRHEWMNDKLFRSFQGGRESGVILRGGVLIHRGWGCYIAAEYSPPTLFSQAAVFLFISGRRSKERQILQRRERVL